LRFIVTRGDGDADSYEDRTPPVLEEGSCRLRSAEGSRRTIKIKALSNKMRCCRPPCTAAEPTHLTVSMA